jgi:hypothetical protein
MNQPTKSSLSAAQTQLIQLLQAVNFGRVEALQVTQGQPSFDPPPRVIQKLKFGGGENGPRAEFGYGDFRLKHGVVELLELISSIEKGEIRSIEIRFGLPCTVELEWQHHGDPAGAVPSATQPGSKPSESHDDSH